jgi:hypothetical protein
MVLGYSLRGIEMIALFIALIIATALLALSWVSRNHPIPTVRRGLMVGCSGASVLIMIVGLSLYPASQVWQSSRASDAALKSVEVETARATAMIAQLGSPAAYIEYLKARKGE